MDNKRAIPGRKLKTCSRGHQYYKGSDCPVCPVCENMKKPDESFSSMVAPARRALENAGIRTPEQVSKYTVTQLLEFHGIGPSSIPKLRKVLKSKGLSFKRK